MLSDLVSGYEKFLAQEFCYGDVCNIVLLERQFPLAFYGGTVSEVNCKFSHWVTCISQRRETTAVFAAY